jgi:Zn-dependent peptidase ImmA (M78 family)
MFSSKRERDAMEMARKVRAEAGLGDEPIADIFGLLERLGVLFLRYPLGEKAIEGYAARRGGQRTIFTNTSYSRGKEIFTAAHELAHLYFDLQEEGIIADEAIHFDNADLEVSEVRANYFAAHFLMPLPAVVCFCNDIVDVEPKAITAQDVVRMQQHFRVSFQAALIRLKALNLITPAAAEKAQKYDGCSSLTELVRRCGYEPELLYPDEKIHVPAGIIQKAVALYEAERIPYGSFSHFLQLIGKTPEEFGLEPRDDGGADDEA